MKFTLDWLKTHLETDATLDQIVERLTMLGLEVEGVEDRAKGLDGFVVAHVDAAEKHPDADKLQICTVNTGKETLQVVCGAPNARKGMKGVFAPSGAYIPGSDITLKKAKIRGVESNGMLLSEREMGLSEEHDGIIELSDDASVGTPAVDALGLGDPIIEIAITPNRGDCLSVQGIARDLAASGLGTLKPVVADPVPGLMKSPKTVRLAFDGGNDDACPYFVGRYVRGVKNAESPKWLQDRLRAIGLRPISALVDITNWMTFDLGRPLHVFDADKLDGDLHVRLARNGEELHALDDKTYTLDDTMTVIADDSGPQALGGVMGGELSGCSETTENVFIESAVFDPVRTAQTGRKLNLMSDARYRFERGIDNAFTQDGMEMATRLVLDLCGGEPSELVVAGALPDTQKSIAFRPARIQALTGVDIPLDEVTRILGILGFGISGGGETLDVSVPTWRNDVEMEACLIEEVVRVFGYDHIPSVSLERESAMPRPVLTQAQAQRATLRRLLASRGLVEAVTYSFMPAREAALFADVPDSLRLANPISADLDVMRPSILPNLVAALGRNAARGIFDGALFEVGPQFSGDAPSDQALVAVAVRAHKTGPRHWAQPARAVDAFDAKADALAALSALDVPVDNLQVQSPASQGYHPGRSGLLTLGPKNVLAAFGELHPGVLADMGIKGPIVACEIYLDALPPKKAKKGAAKPLLQVSQFQPIERDFAFVVDAAVKAGALMRAVRSADKALIVDVAAFDVFSGEGVGEGKKSVAISVALQPIDATLTDADIEAVSEKIVSAVAKATGGQLRS